MPLQPDRTRSLEMPHYTPRPYGSQLWMFTTPSGQVTGIPSEERAAKIAADQRRQDIEEAYSGSTSQIAKALRAYFDSLTAKPTTR